MPYNAADTRYDTIEYKRVGKSGLQLPGVSLGLWNNFGTDRPLDTQRAILRRAFDLGINHFDLANNYGPPAGSAESNFGTIYTQDFVPYRDELILSTKAGYDMWPGPFGEWGSRKYLLASLDQSLKRMQRRLRRHLLLPPPRPEHADRGDHGGTGDRGAVGQGALCRGLELRPRADACRGCRARRAQDPADHPPAAVQHVRPSHRERAVPGARPDRCRQHRVLAARPGTAHRPLPRRHDPTRLSCGRGTLAQLVHASPTTTSPGCGRSTTSPTTAASRSRSLR